MMKKWKSYLGAFWRGGMPFAAFLTALLAALFATHVNGTFGTMDGLLEQFGFDRIWLWLLVGLAAAIVSVAARMWRRVSDPADYVNASIFLTAALLSYDVVSGVIGAFGEHLLSLCVWGAMLLLPIIVCVIRGCRFDPDADTARVLGKCSVKSYLAQLFAGGKFAVTLLGAALVFCLIYTFDTKNFYETITATEHGKLALVIAAAVIGAVLVLETVRRLAVKRICATDSILFAISIGWLFGLAVLLQHITPTRIIAAAAGCILPLLLLVLFAFNTRRIAEPEYAGHGALAYWRALLTNFPVLAIAAAAFVAFVFTGSPALELILPSEAYDAAAHYPAVILGGAFLVILLATGFASRRFGAFDGLLLGWDIYALLQAALLNLNTSTAMIVHVAVCVGLALVLSLLRTFTARTPLPIPADAIRGTADAPAAPAEAIGAPDDRTTAESADAEKSTADESATSGEIPTEEAETAEADCSESENAAETAASEEAAQPEEDPETLAEDPIAETEETQTEETPSAKEDDEDDTEECAYDFVEVSDEIIEDPAEEIEEDTVEPQSEPQATSAAEEAVGEDEEYETEEDSEEVSEAEDTAVPAAPPIAFAPIGDAEDDNPFGMRSCTAKKTYDIVLRTLPDEIKGYYSEIKNAMLRYRMKSRTSKNKEEFKKKGTTMSRVHPDRPIRTQVRIVAKGKAFKMLFNLDAATLDASHFHHKDMSANGRATDLPTCIRVTSNRMKERALELIDILAEQEGFAVNKKYVALDFTTEISDTHLTSFERNGFGYLVRPTARLTEVKDMPDLEPNAYTTDACLDTAEKPVKFKMAIADLARYAELGIVNLDILKQKSVAPANANRLVVAPSDTLSQTITVRAAEFEPYAALMIAIAGGDSIIEIPRDDA